MILVGSSSTRDWEFAVLECGVCGIGARSLG